MPTARGRSVGPEWTSAVSTMSLAVVTALLVGTLYWAQSIFVPVALAVLFSFVLAPAVAWVQRRGLGRTAAVIVVVLSMFLLCVSVGGLVAQQLSKMADTLPTHQPNIVRKVRAAKAWVLGDGKESKLGELIEEVTDVISPSKTKADGPPAGDGEEPLPATGRPVPVVMAGESSSWLTRLKIVISPAAEVLGTAAFTNVLVIFMLLGKEDLRNRMIRLIGHGRVTTTTKAVDDASTRISNYLLTQLALNAGFGVVMTIGLAIIGLPYPVLWGFIAFVMRYIPYVGTPLGVLPPALLALAVADGWGMPIAVLVLFLGSEAVCNNVFEPWLYGSSMGLSQVAQLVAAGFWAFLWGPIGLILSGPLTVCLLVVGKYVPRFRFLEVLLGDEPALEPRVAFYQRLAARDQDEAAQIGLDALKAGSSVEAVFDGVIVSALTLAKRDHREGHLSDADLDEVVRTAREVAAEVAEAGRAAADAPAAGAVVVDGADDRVRLLIAPAKGTADLAAAEMLSHLLDPARWEAEVISVDTLASELVEKVRTFDPAAVVVVALPPGGVSHTRYTVTRLRRAFPKLRMAVGRWGCVDDVCDPAEDVGVAGADGPYPSMADTLKHLTEWAPVLAGSAGPTAGAGPIRPGVGTPAAAVG